MATEVMSETVPIVGRRISWGALFAGGVAALAVWALLYTLGVAIGLTVIDAHNPSSLRGSGMFSGIWGVLTPLVALFVGGVVAGRGCGALRRSTGALHGFLTWALTLLAGAWLVAQLISTLVGGALSLGKTAMEAGGGVISGVAQSPKMSGLDANSAVEPINARLRAEGKPTITPDQLQAATRDAIGQAAGSGQIDRDALVQSLTTNTALSPSDANEVADRIQSQFSGYKQKLSQVGQSGAAKAADVGAKTFWGVFLALILGLITATVGGLVGVPGALLVKRRRRRVVTPEEIPHGELHPA